MSEKIDQRPVIIRHRYSGVWICRILGPGTWGHTIRIEGRRVWSWSGERLECSQLAAKGVREQDTLGDWCEPEIAIGEGDGLVEIIGTTDELVNFAKSLPRHEV